MAASAVSKRQQARNERALQDLLRTVPGNDRCADCSAKNPGWASWNLGIFLCMRCAALHRKLGTHISKVKSLSMDSWSMEQVENMKAVGNAVGNKRFNPGNVKPQIPVDADEVEAAIEKHIRLKYEQKVFSGGAPAPALRQNTGSTGTRSWNEEPPALPPKPAKRFGFSLRSASSTFPRQKPDRNFTPPLSPTFPGSERSAEPPSPHKASKPSQVFGMKITGVNNNFDAKLASLRDMGFNDTRRNSDVLKSTNSNLDRAIEVLIRLGDGNKPVSQTPTPGPGTMTPVSMASTGVNGITIEKTRQSEAKKVNNNPWEIQEETPQRAATQPLPQQYSGPAQIQNPAPASNSWNPFLSQSQQHQQTLQSSFQNLQLSSAGPIQQQYSWQPQLGAHPQYQSGQIQAAANPWDALHLPQQSANNPAYSQQFQPAAPVQQTQQTGNPFLRQTQSQTFSRSNPWAQTSSLSPAAIQQPGNPFRMPWEPQSVVQQPTMQSPAPMYGQQQEYFMQPQQTPPVQQSQQPQQMPGQDQAQQNFMFGTRQAMYQPQQVMLQSRAAPQQQWSQQQPSPQQYSQPLQPLEPSRHDKSSILALYNYPQLAPPRPLQSLPEDSMAAIPQGQPQQQPQRSVTMPVQQMSSANTFGVQPPMTMQSVRHVSKESADFQGMTGRHSPDAFAGLSARYVR